MRSRRVADRGLCGRADLRNQPTVHGSLDRARARHHLSRLQPRLLVRARAVLSTHAHQPATMLFVAALVALAVPRARAWALPSRSPSLSASPAPFVFTPFPGATAVRGNVLNAVSDFLRPAAPEGGPSRATFIARRRLQQQHTGSAGDGGGGGGDAAGRSLQAPSSAPTPAARLTCAAGPRNDTPATVNPAPVFHVSDWCFLAHLQPNVPAAFVGLRSVTIFVPTDAAFRVLLLAFPAFYNWLTASLCIASPLNRLEYFLFSHATSLNVSCFDVRCAARAESPPFRTLNAQAWEKLQLGVLPQGGSRDGFCEPRGNSTCALDSSRGFDASCRTAAHVEWEFSGNNGVLAPISRVLPPRGHPQAAFPSRSLYTAITAHPQMSLFSQLLYNGGLLGDLLLANASWRARTVFAPLDSAFAAVPQAQLDYLLGPSGRVLARYVALTHVLRGVTYVHACTLKRAAGTLGGNVTQATESGAQVVIGVAPRARQYAAAAGAAVGAAVGVAAAAATDVAAAAAAAAAADADVAATGAGAADDSWALTLSFPTWQSVPAWAETAPGAMGVETTTGVLHAVSGLLLDATAWGRLNQGASGGGLAPWGY